MSQIATYEDVRWAVCRTSWVGIVSLWRARALRGAWKRHVPRTALGIWFLRAGLGIA